MLLLPPFVSSFKFSVDVFEDNEALCLPRDDDEDKFVVVVVVVIEGFCIVGRTIFDGAFKPDNRDCCWAVVSPVVGFCVDAASSCDAGVVVSLALDDDIF